MRKFLARAGASIGTSTPRDIKLSAGTEKEHVIKVAVGERGKFHQAVRDASEMLRIALKERMPDAPIIAALLKLLDGRAIPEPIPSSYGADELETVIRHFAPHATTAAEAAAAAAADPDDSALKTAAKLAQARSDKIKAPDYICADKLRSEWSKFKFEVLKNKRGVGYRGASSLHRFDRSIDARARCTGIKNPCAGARAAHAARSLACSSHRLRPARRARAPPHARPCGGCGRVVCARACANGARMPTADAPAFRAITRSMSPPSLAEASTAQSPTRPATWATPR